MDVIERWTVEADGIRYRVILEPDYDASPDDADCYSPSDIEAFKRDDWWYVGVIVTPELDIPNGEYSSVASGVSVSLWGVEYGHNDGWKSKHVPTGDIGQAQINDYPVPDLISEARAKLRAFRKALAGISLDDCQATHPDHAPNVANAHCRRAAGHEMPHRADFGDWADAPAPQSRLRRLARRLARH